MTKTLRGLRGATTAAANTREAILNATAELLRTLQEANGFRPEEVESAIFTSSPDLTAEYPARAARLLGWVDVPLLGAAEVAVPDGLPRCIRVLLHFYTAKPQRELKHMYLRRGQAAAGQGRTGGRPDGRTVTATAVVRTVIVSAKGAARWQAGHPWIYRTDLYDEPGDTPGIVAVTDRRSRHLGQALYSPKSEIRLRLLTRGREPVDATWWQRSIASAAARRAGLAATAYRV